MRAFVLPSALLGLLLAGCGLKGPLSLPEPAGPVTIRPATTTAPTAAPTATPAAEEPAEVPASGTDASAEPPPAQEPGPQRD